MFTIVSVFNAYRQSGGEERVFEAECQMLRQRGQRVIEYRVDPVPTDRWGLRKSLALASDTVWSTSSGRELSMLLRNHQATLVHFHNTFPRISPSAIATASRLGWPVVQTLHNFRLLCPSATLHRDGHICEDCLNKNPPYPAIVHACYRNSRAQTAVVAAMLTSHRLRGTWTRDVDRYIALTEFARAKFLEGGLPADRIVVKPNFARIKRAARGCESDRFLFVGRLTPEKGVKTLLEAAKRVPRRLTLRVAGEGPLSQQVARAPLPLTSLGQIAPGRVAAEMRSAQALVFPSEWYEGFPMIIVEAFGHALPVISSNLGSMAEIIKDGTTGLLFEPGNADDLAAKIRWAAQHPEEMRHMGENARREYEAKYTPERNYETLMQIYHDAIDHRRRQCPY